MKKLSLSLAGIALFTACSSDVEERRAPADDNLIRPLEVARVDTSHPLAPVEHQVTTPAQPPAKPAPRKAKRLPRKTLPAVATPASAPKEDTTTVQGYAPSPSPDTASSLDSTSAPDTTMARDTVPVDTSDTVSPAPVNAALPPPDTATAPVSPVSDTAMPHASRAVDSTRPPATDTVAARTADTASTAVADPMVGRDTSPAVAQPPSAEVGATRTLAIGTVIHAALDDSINSRTDKAGRTVTAVVMENVTGSDGKTLIPAGAPVRFTVTRLRAAHSKGSQGRLALQVEEIGVGGELRPVAAEVRPVPRELRGRGVTAGDAAKVGVGAAGGAVLGKVIGKNTKGAVIGGVIGAAGGAVVASQTATRDVVVKARTPVTFVLTEQLVVR